MSHRKIFGQLTANASWLYLDRLVRGVLSLIVGILVARYLGPAQFGIYSYVVGLVALVTFVGTLGLDIVIVRMLVQTPEHESEILGTSAALRLGGGIVAYAITVGVVAFSRSGDATSLALAFIIGLSPILQVGDVIDLFFQSRLQASSTVKCKLSVGAAMIATRLALIYFGAGLLAFAFTIFLELFLMACCLAARFRRDGGRIRSWKFDWPRARGMLQAGWPLMTAAAAVTIYLRIDQVMLANITGDRAVAMFSAAARITEIFAIGATVFAQTVFPAMSRLHATSPQSYNRTLSALLSIAFWTSLAYSVFVAMLSRPLIILIYGQQYADAAPVLAVYVFNTVIVSMSVVFTPKYVLDNITKISLYGTIAGAIFSVIANLILIPRYGAMGAAYSAVTALVVPTLFIGTFFRRDVGLFFLRAPFAISDLAFVIKKIRDAWQSQIGPG